MKKLIDREELYNKVYQLACDNAGVIDGICSDYAEGLATAAHMIEEAPTVDAVPVIHAEWILRHASHGPCWECSHCHEDQFICVMERTKFCPNCGARMDEKR